MKVNYVKEAPAAIEEIGHDELADRMTSKDVHDVAEIFQTPLTGSYNWDYTVADNRINRLYELGKKLNWNAQTDIDWDKAISRDQSPVLVDDNPYKDLQVWKDMSEEEQIAYQWHELAWTQSQFLHGEQGALLVASQLVSCAPTFNAKLYAASQTFDEARHVEVYTRYLQEKVGMVYPISPWLKVLLDKVLQDERWDLKFIGMQIIIEGLALAAFNQTKMTTSDPCLRQLVHYVIRDEARHVTFGVNYLEEFVQTLTQEEREERAEFAFEACVIMRERLINTHSPTLLLGIDEEEARKRVFENSLAGNFRNLLFTRVVPNLSRIGLLTDAIRPKFEELGLLDYEEQPSDWEIDWATMEKNYEQNSEIDAQAKDMRDDLHQSLHG